MNALELLEQEYLQKRSKLEKQLIISNLLPTNNKTIAWMGEDGWDSQGNAKPPVEKTCPILPYLFHDPTVYAKAVHIAYKAPDDFKWTNGKGESSSSKFRTEFVNKYVLAVVDIYRAYMIQIVAVKGSKYSGTFPTKFDFTTVREYEDAKEIAYGDAEIYTTAGMGEHSFISGTFSFYVEIKGIGTMKVDVEAPGMSRLAPVAHGISRYGEQGPVSSVQSWSAPKLPRRTTHISTYGGGDTGNRSKSMRYLFDTVDDALVCLGVLPE